MVNLLPGAAHANELVERLRERLTTFSALALPHEGRRHAAVALVIVEEGHGAEVRGLARPASWSTAPALLLTRRAAHLNRHAGQWALPGGRVDAGETPEAAALRELEEEVGLVLDASAVLGRLDDYATRSGYVITPVVMAGGAARSLTANPSEVESVHRIRLAEFAREDAPLLNEVPQTGTTVLRMPVGEQWIAAPTAAFLFQLRELIAGRVTRVAHLDQPYFAWR